MRKCEVEEGGVCVYVGEGGGRDDWDEDGNGGSLVFFGWYSFWIWCIMGKRSVKYIMGRECLEVFCWFRVVEIWVIEKEDFYFGMVEL